ncbi:DUF945 family protein [Caviibacterium pharyngocola]|uniref:DUF945 family protein n=1 Tax=Caviibacterium pharyngocola TaxID=28159 RepID=UPI0024340F8E|nr:DUF945 family protein [Caviibacterium pharyngocola]
MNQKLTLQSADGKLQGQIENVNFSRGIFSSDVRYDVVMTHAPDNVRYTVSFVGKLYHGPLTVNNFSFALFSAEMSVEKKRTNAKLV